MADKSKYEIEIRTTAAGDGAKKTVKELDGLKSKANEVKTTLDGLGIALPQLAGATIGAGVIKFLQGSIAAANESEEANVRLANTLANVGKYSTEAVAQIDELTGRYQTLTNISDETFTAAAATLLEFGASVEELPELFPVIEGLAGRLGGDVPAAARLLGLAISGNTRGLAQFGIQLSDNATQAEIMDKVAREAAKGQGLLEAQTKTLAGATKTLAVAWDGLQEEFGKTLTEGGELSGVIKSLAGGVSFLTENLNTILKVANSFGGIGSIFKAVGLVFGETTKQTSLTANAAKNLDEESQNAGKGMKGAAEDAKALAAELKAAEDAAKSTSDSLEKITQLRREITLATETPQQKSERLVNEEKIATARLAAGFENATGQPFNRGASPQEIFKQITPDAVKDPQQREDLLRGVLDVIKAQKAVRDSPGAFSGGEQLGPFRPEFQGPPRPPRAGFIGDETGDRTQEIKAALDSFAGTVAGLIRRSEDQIKNSRS